MRAPAASGGPWNQLTHLEAPGQAIWSVGHKGAPRGGSSPSYCWTGQTAATAYVCSCLLKCPSLGWHDSEGLKRVSFRAFKKNLGILDKRSTSKRWIRFLLYSKCKRALWKARIIACSWYLENPNAALKYGTTADVSFWKSAATKYSHRYMTKLNLWLP